MADLLDVVARDGVFVVSFFVIVGVGLWLLGGGPMRAREQRTLPRAPAQRGSRGGLGAGIGRLLSAMALGILWLVSGFWWLISWRLRRYLIERNARRLAKGGTYKNKN